MVREYNDEEDESANSKSVVWDVEALQEASGSCYGVLPTLSTSCYGSSSHLVLAVSNYRHWCISAPGSIWVPLWQFVCYDNDHSVSLYLDDRPGFESIRRLRENEVVEKTGK